MKASIELFEGIEIRTVERHEEKWMSALDVAKALKYSNPSATVSNMIERNKERLDPYTACIYLETSGGKQKNTMFNIKGVIAFCMLSNQKEAITFQRWADSVLEREITKIKDENTSDIRIIAKKKRLEFTDTLKEHGYKSPHEYIQTTKQMKEGLGIDGKKKKAECDDIEVMKIQTAEMLARTKIMIENANGYKSVNPLCVESSKIINQNTQRQLNN